MLVSGALRFIRSLAAAVALVPFACSSSGTAPGQLDAGKKTDGPTGGDGSTSNSMGCQQAGGTCGCAGGCNPGFSPAPAPLLYQCPQPCDECGACSQECCLPNAEADAGGDGGCVGTFNCLCGEPVCVAGEWECQGSC